MLLASSCGVMMIYVDESLCTGCGVCLDACKQGALSIEGGKASIDESLCTSCGRCVDVCPTEAIVSVETIEECPSTSVPAQSPQARPFWAGTNPLSPVGRDAAASAAASPAPADSAPSKLETAERVLSGLLSFASFVLDRRQTALTGRPAARQSDAVDFVLDRRQTALTGRPAARQSDAVDRGRTKGGAQRTGCPRRGQGCSYGGGGRGQGLGRARGPGLGRGSGSGRGRNDRTR